MSIRSYFKQKSVDMKRSLVFFTHAVQGTLGDVSGTVKLIQSIKKHHAESLDVMIVVIADAENKSKASSLLKDLEVSTLVVDDSELKHLLAFKENKSQNAEPNLQNALRSADGIVVSLTCRHFQQIADLTKFAKPLFVINEYDPHPDNLTAIKELLSFKRIPLPTAIMNAGLKKEHLGVFCTNETESSNNTKLLVNIGPADQAFRNLLLQGTDAEHYQKTHQLFFGYFNAMDLESSANDVNVAMFIESSLHLVSPQVRTVDFVLPIKFQGAKTYQQEGRYKQVQELLAYFKQNPKLIEGYRIEFWYKNSGEMQRFPVSDLEQKEEADTKVIRIINGFPFLPDTMNILMKASDELVMVTGDQSVSEAISNNKIFIYQTMWWKELLWESLLDLVKEIQAESKYYQFLKMQGDYRNNDLPVFKQFLLENKTEICQGSLILRQYLLENKDLSVNFPKQLFSYIDNPTKIIKETIKYWPSYFRATRLGLLIEMYPDEATLILNTTLEEHKYKNKKEFMEDLVMVAIYNKNHESLIKELDKLWDLYPNDTEYLFDALINQRKIKLEKLKNLDPDDYIVFAAINAFCNEGIKQGILPEVFKPVVEEINRIKEKQRAESEQFLQEQTPEITNRELLKTNGFICKIISDAAAIHKEQNQPAENKTECNAKLTFIDFLKKTNKGTPLTVNLIKALDILSRFQPSLTNLNFNQKTVDDIAELFEKEQNGYVSVEDAPSLLLDVLSKHKHGLEVLNKDREELSPVRIKMPHSPSIGSYKGTLLEPPSSLLDKDDNEDNPEDGFQI